MDKYVSEEEYNNILGELNKKIDDIIPDRNFRSVLHSRLEYGNEHSLRKRFDKLFKENYKNIFNVSKKKIDNFIEGAIKTRNYLIHQDHRLKDNSYRDEEYFNSIDILKTLIEIIVLKEIGFKESQIKIFYQNRIKNNNLNINY
jgi:hypothetical protein